MFDLITGTVINMGPVTIPIFIQTGNKMPDCVR